MIIQHTKSSAKAPVELVPGALYQAPSGRICTLCPSDTVHPQSAYATLLYERRDGKGPQSAFGDGVTLAARNWHLLRRVA